MFSISHLGVPLLAITGTATKRLQCDIAQQRAMGKDTLTINISPNRDNIKFEVVKTSKGDQREFHGWLTDMVKEQNILAPQCIIFCSTMHDVAKLFGFLLAEFADGAYANGKPETPANRLVGIYHSMTLPKYKSRVS